MPDAGDIVTVDFPGVTGVKRRPAVVLSSSDYHTHRPDVILGIITSQTADATTPLDCVLRDWSSAGLHRASAFRWRLARSQQQPCA
jgi:mRNA interferase MazF